MSDARQRNNQSQQYPPSAGVASGHAQPEYWFEEGCFITELMNNGANPDQSIARARVPAGTGTKWHRLQGTTERYVVLSGSGMVWIGEQAAQQVVAGDCVTIPPAMAQRIDADAGDDLVFLAICTPRFLPENYLSGSA